MALQNILRVRRTWALCSIFFGVLLRREAPNFGSEASHSSWWLLRLLFVSTTIFRSFFLKWPHRVWVRLCSLSFFLTAAFAWAFPRRFRVFLLAATTFNADTGAYFAGHLFGRHKLAPKVSPGKTVEGLVGGIIGSLIAAFLCREIFWEEFRILDCWIVGILVGIIGPLGDLSESLVKRSLGVKDSGQLIPGHGGLLDRLDALLFTAPLVYYYATFFY